MTILHDGKLTDAEALGALSLAAQQATKILPEAFSKCQTDDERQRVIDNRDAIVLAYLNSLKKSLVHSAQWFENIANQLDNTSNSLEAEVKKAQNAFGVIGLYADLLKLAAALALAFG